MLSGWCRCLFRDGPPPGGSAPFWRWRSSSSNVRSPCSHAEEGHVMFVAAAAGGLRVHEWVRHRTMCLVQPCEREGGGACKGGLRTASRSDDAASLSMPR